MYIEDYFANIYWLNTFVFILCIKTIKIILFLWRLLVIWNKNSEWFDGMFSQHECGNPGNLNLKVRWPSVHWFSWHPSLASTSSLHCSVAFLTQGEYSISFCNLLVYFLTTFCVLHIIMYIIYIFCVSNELIWFVSLDIFIYRSALAHDLTDSWLSFICILFYGYFIFGRGVLIRLSEKFATVQGDNHSPKMPLVRHDIPLMVSCSCSLLGRSDCDFPMLMLFSFLCSFRRKVKMPFREWNLDWWPVASLSWRPDRGLFSVTCSTTKRFRSWTATSKRKQLRISRNQLFSLLGLLRKRLRTIPSKWLHLLGLWATRLTRFLSSC